MLEVLVPAHFTEILRGLTADMEVRFIPYDKEGVPEARSPEVSALFRWWLSVPAGDALIRDHPKLRWIHTGSAGVDHILTPLFLRSNIVLTNSSGVHATSIAEWVVTAILAGAKKLPQLLEQQRGHVWQTIECDELAGKRAIVLGAGHIAKEIARRLRRFGVSVDAVRRNAAADPAFDGVHPVRALESLLRDADWFIITAPLTDETRDLVDRRIIAALPRRARIVNVARGEIVDEAALTDALRNGALDGAILDVFREEPLPADNPLWDMPNVMILPHTTWRSPQVKQKQLALFVRNLRRFAAGEAMENVVDPRRGY